MIQSASAPISFPINGRPYCATTVAISSICSFITRLPRARNGRDRKPSGPRRTVFPSYAPASGAVASPVHRSSRSRIARPASDRLGSPSERGVLRADGGLDEQGGRHEQLDRERQQEGERDQDSEVAEVLHRREQEDEESAGEHDAAEQVRAAGRDERAPHRLLDRKSVV